MKCIYNAIIIALLSHVCALNAAEPTYVWWEGEDFAKTNIPEPLQSLPGNANPEQQEKLSGGKWFTTQGPESDKPYKAQYSVNVPTTKNYNLWVRKFWKHGPFKWKFDNNDWVLCEKTRALHDSTALEKHWSANWVFLGKVDLKEGKRQLDIEMLDAKGGGCIDCFLLIDGSFIPRGKLKPGEKSGATEAGRFAWEPDGDPADGSSPIDLRYLNEKRAGQSGHVRRKGQGFVLGDGTPVRFLEKGTVNPYMSDEMIRYRGKRLAKYGVNLMRIGFARKYPLYKKGQMDQFNHYLDRIHYMVSAFREEGMYTWIRLYWDTGQTEFFFDPEFRKHYLDYAKHIMNTKNPYTGLSMAEDPAVAVCAIQNENNLLFWTFNPKNRSKKALQQIEKAFGDWATQKYGSIDKALTTWGNDKHPSNHIKKTVDVATEGRLALYAVGHLTGADWAAAQRNPKRASDQLRFMVEAQKKTYADIVKYFREDLGFKCLISCSNWKTADSRVLGPFEHYSYTEGDMVTRNIYFGPTFKPKPKRFYAIDVGDTFTPHTSLKAPKNPTSFTVAHTNDMPYTITENNWDRPNKYRSEWPFLVAAYGSMLGADSWSFAGNGGPLWNTSMQVWDVNSPSVMGQLPAVALAFRKYIKEAPTVVTDTLALNDLYEFKGASVNMGKGADALWISKIGDKEGAKVKDSGKVDPLAFFVGKVERKIGDAPSKLESIDLNKYIDRKKGTVKSITGEIEWDYVNGMVKLTNPYVQGACGFLKQAGSIDLGDVSIQSQNDFGVVMVVALDDKPLKESKKILIQTATDDRTYGFKLKDLGDGRTEIIDVGQPPLMVTNIKASVTIKNRVGCKVDVLNQAGYPRGDQAQTSADQGSTKISLPQDTIYTLCTFK